MTAITRQPPALDALIALRGRSFVSDVSVTGQGPHAPTRFKVGETVGAVVAATGGIVADLAAARGGPVQPVTCDARAAAASLAMNHLTRVAGPDGTFVAPAPDPNMAAMRKLTQPWPTRDGRHFLPHLNLPQLRARVLGELGCGDTAEAVRTAVAGRDAQELETAIARARACGGMIRTRADWRDHPQGQLLASRPVITIERIGDAPPEPVPGGARPLSTLRVLDLTRILAGPIAARELASHGADVLMITAPHLAQTPDHVRDTSHGKRSAYLDLNTADDMTRLRELIRTTDVFSQGYRPGTLNARGLGPEALAQLRPGIVTLSISCYGHGGPLSDRAGWEQVAQAVTGICAEQGPQGQPELIPLPVCDYLTGYLGALGTLMALERRATEGGSWHVQVSLCRSAMFLQDQGFSDATGELPTPADLAPWFVDSDGARGVMRHLGPVVQMPETPPFWARQSPILGQDRPEWI
ncbi:CoA transferase [Puniceibacterium sp. IMCC21224]|uniref:CoA transferase n=1 Tax=Puniceibacterium sp. IMCC21224 TaxID=1618204 RepID=UPI00064D89BD|nr:CoA transferase [Puniceibacterium sp. IMCC21224]KMK65923.1 CoA-transferase family III [Puniceibacterium sp. IMCC21224]